MSYARPARATNGVMNTTQRDTDPAALRHVLIELHHDAYTWALNCCDRNRADAEDVLQATYLKVLDGRARFEGRSSMLTWLFSIVRKTAADQRRRRLMHKLLLDPLAIVMANADPEPPAEVRIEQSQLRALLMQALAALPRRQREVLLLVFYHELTIEEAARAMDTSLGSARKHYARGKQRLRTLLAETGVSG